SVGRSRTGWQGLCDSPKGSKPCYSFRGLGAGRRKLLRAPFLTFRADRLLYQLGGTAWNQTHSKPSPCQDGPSRGAAHLIPWKVSRLRRARPPTRSLAHAGILFDMWLATGRLRAFVAFGNRSALSALRIGSF